MQGAQPIGKLLDNAEGNLQRLLVQAKTLQQLTHEARQHLPGLLAPHCLIANIRGNCLILHTDTAARASLLRYHLPPLIKHLQHHQKLRNLNRASIKIRPRPHLQPPIRSQGQCLKLSSANASLLRCIASGINDPHLEAAFLRLARHATPDAKA